MALRHRDSFNEINITPLTDIFLVLLIIMMVIAPLLDQQGLNLLVPGTEEVKTPKESKVIIVDVEQNGIYTIDGNLVTSENLIYTIKEQMIKKKDGLLIQADDEATHGAVVKVMDAARNAGVTSITVDER
ncbi:MAG: biopolymer transporter ExbD [Candidatus Gastranaerophilales bacterium]|nr:biopolymer transporter ExbD [Candidatus Gastranaerophilales bacterium]